MRKGWFAIEGFEGPPTRYIFLGKTKRGEDAEGGEREPATGEVKLEGSKPKKLLCEEPWRSSWGRTWSRSFSVDWGVWVGHFMVVIRVVGSKFGYLIALINARFLFGGGWKLHWTRLVESESCFINVLHSWLCVVGSYESHSRYSCCCLYALRKARHT